MENVNHHNHHITNITTSPRHHITTSPHHHITTSPRHHITTSPHHHVTTSPHHNITTLPHHIPMSTRPHFTSSHTSPHHIPSPHHQLLHQLAKQSLQIAMGSLRQADVGEGGNAQNPSKPYAFSHKVLPGVDVGNLVCATGAALRRDRTHPTPYS